MAENTRKKYRKIDPNIWNDERFNQLSDDGKLAFFFLLTHPHMTSIGAMRGTLSGLSIELGWTPERLCESLSLTLTERMVVYNKKASLIWLPNSLKYNAPDNPNVVKAWAKILKNLPECDEKYELYQLIKELLKGFSKGFSKAFAESFAKGYGNTGNKEQGTRSPPKSIPPQDEEIIDTGFNLEKETGEIVDFVGGGF